MRSIRTVGIFLTSAAVGAGLALLFAPQSGARTRRQIRMKAESCAKDLLEDVNASAHELSRRGMENARHFLRQVRHAA